MNSLAQLGGLVGPALVGALSQAERGPESTEHAHALAILGSCAVAAGLLCACFTPRLVACSGWGCGRGAGVATCTTVLAASSSAAVEVASGQARSAARKL